MLITAIEAKRLALLHELVPSAMRIAIAVNPNSPDAGKQVSDLETACRSLGLVPQILRIGTEGEIDASFERAVQNEAQALLVASDPFFNSQRARIVALAEGYKLPAMYEAREYVIAGGLMSYGPDIADMYRALSRF